MDFSNISNFIYNNSSETYENYLNENGIKFSFITEAGYSLIFRVDDYCLKVIPIYEDEEEDQTTEIANEVSFIKNLNEKILNLNISDHILKYYGYLEINGFPFIFDNIIFHNFINKYNKKITKTIILITEYADGGELSNYKASNDELMIYFFQVIYTLFVINNVIPNYSFGDLGFSNLFLKTDHNYGKNKFYWYKIFDKNYYLPSTRYKIIFGDFGSNSIRKHSHDIQDFVREDGFKKVNGSFKELLDDIKHNYQIREEDILKDYRIKSKFLKTKFKNNVIDTFSLE